MRRPRPPVHVVLVGEMGVGKTAIGRHLASIMDRRHSDSDDLLQVAAGMTGRDYVELHGVESLHDVELQVFLDAVAGSEPAVISPAASVVDHPAGREALASHATVWLHASQPVVRGRRHRDGHRRPVDDAEAARLRDRRVDSWAALSSVSIDTTSCSARACAATIAEALRTDGS